MVKFGIGQLRLVSQRIAAPMEAGAADVVRWMMAVQAQDFNGAVTSVALRFQGGTREAVLAALDAGTIVRSWPMRGTLHFVPAEDLGWMLRTTAARMVATSARRHAELGIDDRLIGAARDIALAEMRDGKPISRNELIALWRKAGLLEVKERGYHLIGHLAMTGVLCFGPVRGGEQQLVLIDSWIPHPRRLEPDEALGELALRYFRSHGPATVKDFGWWTKLRAADVKTAVALARQNLESSWYDGVEYLMDPASPALPGGEAHEASGLFLLPGFDEYLLGYQDRSAALRPEFAQRIVPGGNGVFRPTIIRDGQVTGTWKRAGKGVDRRIEPTSFSRRFTKAELRLIERRFATLR
ncbi:winged helix DNA-binding domain-containing protein [Arthrobacter sp. H14]|uniref:winged helix DNA-binding domain-containing protein n=1 Tax=Arthrobacter sp. H14 TaxID=1312959 RepID=UPI000685DB59|nr:winged helix DNA-binding domain-containing protein [Arthrobacter sp. H14]